MRDVLVVRDSNGNLMKYVKSDENPKRNAKPKCDGKAAPAAVVAAPSSPSPASLKPHEIEQAKLPKCSMAVLRLSENDINEIQEKVKKVPTRNKNNNNESPAPESKWSAVVEKEGILEFRSKQFGGNCKKIVILEPVLLRNCVLNPLLEPMFVLGEQWAFDLDMDANLIIQLPERDGRRDKFLFSASTWNAWFGRDDCINAQSMEPLKQHSIKNISNDNTLSLMDLSTSEIQKFLGPDGDEMLAALLASSFLDFTRAEMSISTCDNDENGYDASIEVSLSQLE